MGAASTTMPKGRSPLGGEDVGCSGTIALPALQLTANQSQESFLCAFILLQELCLRNSKCVTRNLEFSHASPVNTITPAQRMCLMDTAALRSLAAEVYNRHGVPADQLPYTEDFEQLYADFVRRSAANPGRAQFWRLLVNARKRGQLPRLKR